MSNANLDGSILKDLISFVETSIRLEELNISWNKFSPYDFEKLFRTLSKNKRLHELNLSWNNVSENIIPAQKKIESAIEDNFEARKRSID